MIDRQVLVLQHLQDVRDAAERAILELLRPDPEVWRLHMCCERVVAFGRDAKAIADDAVRKAVR